jgi:hypothetical protein
MSTAERSSRKCFEHQLRRREPARRRSSSGSSRSGRGCKLVAPTGYGNVLIRAAAQGRARTRGGRAVGVRRLHMDHPGFVAERTVDAAGTLAARHSTAGRNIELRPWARSKPLPSIRDRRRSVPASSPSERRTRYDQAERTEGRGRAAEPRGDTSNRARPGNVRDQGAGRVRGKEILVAPRGSRRPRAAVAARAGDARTRLHREPAAHQPVAVLLTARGRRTASSRRGSRRSGAAAAWRKTGSRDLDSSAPRCSRKRAARAGA